MVKKIITIEKLQSFIEAAAFSADIEDEDQWVPNARQWRRIREMIEQLEETPASINQSVPIQQAPQYQYGAAQQPNPGWQQPSGALSAPPGVQSKLPMPQVPMGPVHLPAGIPIATGDNTSTRTPDIDTTNGNYSSSFA